MTHSSSQSGLEPSSISTFNVVFRRDRNARTAWKSAEAPPNASENSYEAVEKVIPPVKKIVALQQAGDEKNIVSSEIIGIIQSFDTRLLPQLLHQQLEVIIEGLKEASKQVGKNSEILNEHGGIIAKKTLAFGGGDNRYRYGGLPGQALSSFTQTATPSVVNPPAPILTDPSTIPPISTLPSISRRAETSSPPRQQFVHTHPTPNILSDSSSQSGLELLSMPALDLALGRARNAQTAVWKLCESAQAFLDASKNSYEAVDKAIALVEKIAALRQAPEQMKENILEITDIIQSLDPKMRTWFDRLLHQPVMEDIAERSREERGHFGTVKQVSGQVREGSGKLNKHGGLLNQAGSGFTQSGISSPPTPIHVEPSTIPPISTLPTLTSSSSQFPSPSARPSLPLPTKSAISAHEMNNQRALVSTEDQESGFQKNLVGHSLDRAAENKSQDLADSHSLSSIKTAPPFELEDASALSSVDPSSPLLHSGQNIDIKSTTYPKSEPSSPKLSYLDVPIAGFGTDAGLELRVERVSKPVITDNEGNKTVKLELKTEQDDLLLLTQSSIPPPVSELVMFMPPPSQVTSAITLNIVPTPAVSAVTLSGAEVAPVLICSTSTPVVCEAAAVVSLSSATTQDSNRAAAVTQTGSGDVTAVTSRSSISNSNVCVPPVSPVLTPAQPQVVTWTQTLRQVPPSSCISCPQAPPHIPAHLLSLILSTPNMLQHLVSSSVPVQSGLQSLPSCSTTRDEQHSLSPTTKGLNTSTSSDSPSGLKRKQRDDDDSKHSRTGTGKQSKNFADNSSAPPPTFITDAVATETRAHISSPSSPPSPSAVPLSPHPHHHPPPLHHLPMHPSQFLLPPATPSLQGQHVNCSAPPESPLFSPAPPPTHSLHDNNPASLEPRISSHPSVHSQHFNNPVSLESRISSPPPSIHNLHDNIHIPLESRLSSPTAPLVHSQHFNNPASLKSRLSESPLLGTSQPNLSQGSGQGKPKRRCHRRRRDSRHYKGRQSSSSDNST